MTPEKQYSLTTSPPHAGFSWRIRVYYEDTDSGGMVFYANYLKFFERARTEWLRAAGVSQYTLEQTDGVIFVVKSISVDYSAPAKLDDALKLTVAVERIGRVAIDFIQQAWRLGDDAPTLLATGRITVACVDSASFRLRAIPTQVIKNIKSGDNGKASAETPCSPAPE